MIESPVIEKLLAWRIHQLILKLLAGRFAKVPAELEGNLRVIQDEDRLDDLVRWAVQCPDLAAFTARLSP